MGPERRLEQKLCSAVTALGGLALKQTGMRGVPDRLIVLPGPRYIFVEMKAETGVLSAIQHSMIRRLQSLGCRVEVVRGAAATSKLIEEIQDEPSSLPD